jgi:glycerophosphoryl diester phosphodiesterase
LSAWGTSPIVVGHRGGRGKGWPPENTIGAFERARAQGARAIELDVRTCAGAQAVVFHDATLARMTAQRDGRRVSDVRSKELRAIDLGGGETIPTLADVLAWARSHGVAVNVEMKHDVPSRRALARETVRAVRASGADVLLSSFDPMLLVVAAALAPELRRALLTSADQARWAHVVQRIARPPMVQAIHIERTQGAPGAVARHVRRGLNVGVWTVNDPSEARDFVGIGVTSIITDAPGEVLAGLSRT